MMRTYLLVEGQTEEAFVREVLAPHFERHRLYLTPIIVGTSPGHKGGVVSYAKIKPQIQRICQHDAGAYVSTLFDLYALPTDFPGKTAPLYPAQGSGRQKAEFLEACMAKDIAKPNFIPNLLVHEFEALLFVQPDKFSEWTNNRVALQRLLADAQAHDTPEDINESPQTAPSKRILAAMPGYQKTFHGPLIAAEIGLDALRAACPHFHTFLEKLEALVE